jgi:hypothetical protein
LKHLTTRSRPNTAICCATEPFVVTHNVSHRGVDRAFLVGAQLRLYVFTAGPMDTEPAPAAHCHMAHRFELRWMMQPRVLSQLGEEMDRTTGYSGRNAAAQYDSGRGRR